MTEKEKAINWVKKHKGVLKIHAISRETGISNLKSYVNDYKDGRGYNQVLPDKHLPKLVKFINKLKYN